MGGGALDSWWTDRHGESYLCIPPSPPGLDSEGFGGMDRKLEIRLTLHTSPCPLTSMRASVGGRVERSGEEQEGCSVLLAWPGLAWLVPQTG